MGFDMGASEVKVDEEASVDLAEKRVKHCPWKLAI
jgi:hypothetical protein